MYENLTNGPHVTRGYHVKLQCWEYTEQRTREKNIWKIPIRLTSVGLVHACPNYMNHT